MQFWQPLLATAVTQGGASGVTGTSATTDANDVSTASGTTTIVGSSATTDAGDVSTALGTTTVTGASSTTEQSDVSTASGSAGSITGTSATTDADDVSAASGTTAVVGSSATTEADDVNTASGTTTVSGSSATTDEDDTNGATGTTTVTGSSATTDADDVSTASGEVGPLPETGTVGVPGRWRKYSVRINGTLFRGSYDEIQQLIRQIAEMQAAEAAKAAIEQAKKPRPAPSLRVQPVKNELASKPLVLEYNQAYTAYLELEMALEQAKRVRRMRDEEEMLVMLL